jgi:hypothetical protein
MTNIVEFNISLKNKIIALFKEMWEDKNTPEELKIKLNYSIWRSWGGPKQECGILVIRLPWFNIAIINTGDIISLNQFDDIIDATNISNEELAKKVDKLREDFAKNPTTNICVVGPALKYNNNQEQVKEREEIMLSFNNWKSLKKEENNA